jgi:hypothetical protein
MDFAIRCATPEIFQAITATAIDAGYCRWMGGKEAVLIAFRNYGAEGVCIFLRGGKAMGYGGYKYAKEQAIPLFDPQTGFQDVVNAIYFKAILPVEIEVGGYTTKLMPDKKEIEVGCVTVSFDDAHRIRAMIMEKPEPKQRERIVLQCRNELVSRGMEAILLSEGFVWDSRSKSSPLGRNPGNIVLNGEGVATPVSLLSDGYLRGTVLDPETQMGRIRQAMSDIKNGSAESETITAGGKSVRIDRTNRTVSGPDGEAISFNDVEKIYQEMEKLGG